MRHLCVQNIKLLHEVHVTTLISKQHMIHSILNLPITQFTNVLSLQINKIYAIINFYIHYITVYAITCKVDARWNWITTHYIIFTIVFYYCSQLFQHLNGLIVLSILCLHAFQLSNLKVAVENDLGVYWLEVFVFSLLFSFYATRLQASSHYNFWQLCCVRVKGCELL